MLPMAKRLFKLVIDRHSIRQSKNDKKYLIYSVKGMIDLEPEECLKIKKDVDAEIQKIVPNSEIRIVNSINDMNIDEYY